MASGTWYMSASRLLLVRGRQLGGGQVALVPGVVAASNLGAYLTVLGVMIVILMIAGAGLLWFRSRVLRQAREADQQGGMMQDLRAMRDRGDISTEEYDAARQAIVARLSGNPVTRAAGKAPGPSAQTPPSGGELRARPGFDLTGRPLPGNSPPRGAEE